MLHKGTSVLYRSNGILKVLCKVRPPTKRVAAIPLEAVASAILFSDQSFAKIRLSRNVLPVPPGASRKPYHLHFSQLDCKNSCKHPSDLV